jgi:hypothetical protein
VERIERRLDRERHHEAEEQPGRAAAADAGQVERAGAHPERDDADQHQERAHQRVDHEAQRGPHPVGAAPDRHEHRERDQHGLEADVEQRQVAGHEQQRHGRLEQQHQPEVAAQPVATLPERVDQRPRQHEGQQGHEHEREPVHPDVVGEAEVAHPGVALLELDAAGLVEAHQRDRDQRRLGERGRERQGPGHPPRPGNDAHDERARQRQQPERGREPALRGVDHPVPCVMK